MNRKFCSLIFIILVTLLSCKPENQSVVFKSGEDGFRCFRIPALLAVPGKLMAISEGRNNGFFGGCEDFGPNKLVLKESFDEGKTWGPLKTLVDFGKVMASNPTPVFDNTDPRYPKGRIFLFFNRITHHEKEVRKGIGIRESFVMISNDLGETWGPKRNITLDVQRPNAPEINSKYNFTDDWRAKAFQPGHGIQVKSGPYKGRIIVCANFSRPPHPHKTNSYAIYSDDHGETWNHGRPTELGPNECMFAENGNGELLMSARDYRKKLRSFSRSQDGGETWSPLVRKEDIPDPGCQGSILSVPSNSKIPYLLMSNLDHSKDRKNLTLRWSSDGGHHWKKLITIEKLGSAYSDLALIKSKDGKKKIGIIYEKTGLTGKIHIVRSIRFKTYEIPDL